MLPTEAPTYRHVGEDIRPDPDAAGAYVIGLPDGTSIGQRAYWRQVVSIFGEGGLHASIRSLEPDLLRVQRLMQQPAEALAALDDLENAASALQRQGLQPAAALERALAAVEAEHWFPETRVVALGILEPGAFVDLPARGFVVTDIGAGVDHGELAHRLQWAMLMRDYDRSPDAWDHPPFELFTRIGQLARQLDGMVNAAGVQRYQNIWGHLFDQGGLDSNEVENFERNFDGAIVKPDGFRHPERLTRMMDEGGTEVAAIPAVAAGARERYRQRKAAYDRMVAAFPPTYASGDKQAQVDYIEATNTRVAAELKQALLGNGYEVWNDAQLLIHQDDRAAADAENAETTRLRVHLARLDAGKWVTPLADDARDRAEALLDRRAALRENPKPPATPLPTASTAPVTAGAASSSMPPP